MFQKKHAFNEFKMINLKSMYVLSFKKDVTNMINKITKNIILNLISFC